jgi:hypothetical protein
MLPNASRKEKNFMDYVKVGVWINQLPIPKLQVLGTNCKNVGVCVCLRLIEVACTLWRAKEILQRFVMEIDPWAFDVLSDRKNGMQVTEGNLYRSFDKA